jgi:hypothetical protein
VQSSPACVKITDPPGCSFQLLTLYTLFRNETHAKKNEKENQLKIYFKNHRLEFDACLILPMIFFWME